MLFEDQSNRVIRKRVEFVTDIGRRDRPPARVQPSMQSRQNLVGPNAAPAVIGFQRQLGQLLQSKYMAGEKLEWAICVFFQSAARSRGIQPQTGERARLSRARCRPCLPNG